MDQQKHPNEKSNNKAEKDRKLARETHGFAFRLACFVVIETVLIVVGVGSLLLIS
jgi:hypothetical protein